MTIIKKTRDDSNRQGCGGGRSVNWCNHHGKTVWKIFKKIKNRILRDSAIPLLGIDFKDMKSVLQIDIYTLVFTAKIVSYSSL